MRKLVGFPRLLLKNLTNYKLLWEVLTHERHSFNASFSLLNNCLVTNSSKQKKKKGNSGITKSWNRSLPACSAILYDHGWTSKTVNKGKSESKNLGWVYFKLKLVINTFLLHNADRFINLPPKEQHFDILTLVLVLVNKGTKLNKGVQNSLQQLTREFKYTCIGKFNSYSINLIAEP